jgi:hypothetical protein
MGMPLPPHQSLSWFSTISGWVREILASRAGSEPEAEVLGEEFPPLPQAVSARPSVIPMVIANLALIFFSS